MDGWTDGVKPIYSPQTSLCGGITKEDNIVFLKFLQLSMIHDMFSWFKNVIKIFASSQKQVCQAGINNYIAKNTVGYNYLSLPKIPSSGTQILICEWWCSATFFNSHIWQSLSLRDWRWKAAVTLCWMGATFSGSGSWPPRGTTSATRLMRTI